MKDKVWSYIFLPVNIKDLDHSVNLFGTGDHTKDLFQFLSLAELFQSLPGICKECSPFTLYPPQELLKQIVHLFEISPAQSIAVKKKLLSDDKWKQIQIGYDEFDEDADDIILIQSIKPAERLKSSILADLVNYNYLEDPNVISCYGEHLGLSKNLFGDLCIALLGSSQGNYISRIIGKKKLEDACLEFLKHFETQYKDKESIYFNLDYSKLDNLQRPEVDEYCGIEKGYKRFFEEEKEKGKEKQKPEIPKQKKKMCESKANDSLDFDCSYSSTESPEDSSQKNTMKRKKKRNHRLSNLDSDFKPFSRKTERSKPRNDNFSVDSAKLDSQIYFSFTPELNNHNFTDQDKYFNFCTVKNLSMYSSSSHSIKYKHRNKLLHHHYKSIDNLNKPTPILEKNKIPDDYRSEPFAQKMDKFTQSYFSIIISEYFKSLNSTSNTNVDPNTMTESKPEIDSMSHKPLDVPGLSGPDMYDWIKPPLVIKTVNVLDVLCHKLGPVSNQKSNNNNPTLEHVTTSNISHASTIQNNVNCENSNEDQHSLHSRSVNPVLNKNTGQFNLNIFQNTKNNIDFGTRDNKQKHNHNNNTNSDKDLQSGKTNSQIEEKHQLKKEDKSTDPFIFDHGLPTLENREKTIMNLTNFYNDAKNQIDDNSESENLLYEMNENSQYESVTVLKTEPIIDSSVLDTGTNHLINNLDDAVFIFQNNLDVPDTTTQPIASQENDSGLYVKETGSCASNLNLVKTIPLAEELPKAPSNLKVINFKPSSLPLPESGNTTKFQPVKRNNGSVNKIPNNFFNRNVIPVIRDPIRSNQNKVINNAVNFKYISIPEKCDGNKVFLNNKNVKLPIIHMQLPDFSLPTLKIDDGKRDTPPDEDKVNDSTNVKYVVKDKNVFKLLYVNAPSTDNSNNVQVLNLQQSKTEKSCGNINTTTSATCASTTTVKRIISSPNTPNLGIPKHLHFDPQRNNNSGYVSKIVMKTNGKKSGLNIKDASVPAKQAVNIIYQPIKHPSVVGSKNLIVTFPPTKISNKSTDTQTKTVTLPAKKNVNPVCTHKIVLVPTVSETTSPIPDRSNPISSTTMEQVREFESVLEKVKQTSQLKDKVPNDEVITTSLITTNQKSSENLTAVTLGNILLQPTKISTCTDVIYTSDKKLATTDKTFNVKQAPIMIAKSNDKIVKPTNMNPHFPTSRPSSSIVSSNQSSSTSTNSVVKPIQKAQEDEQTAEKIYKILNSYTEKIKNAPELKNKPAPRRRSNPPIINSKCRKSVKCPSKFTYKQTPNLDMNSDTNDKESIPTTPTVFPLGVSMLKDAAPKVPVQIQQLTMPLCTGQDNQVVLLTNDKHIILKKLTDVQKLCQSSPITKPMTKAEPIDGNRGTQVLHYKIRNDAVHGINLINYVSSVNMNHRASIITTMPSCNPGFSNNSSIVSGFSPQKVNKFAQETQTDISMECLTVLNTDIDKYDNPAISKKMDSKVEEVPNKDFKNFDPSSLSIALDKHYFKNIDVLFFTSFIFLNYPSSQLFMFEATYALSRMLRTKSASNSISKHYSTQQMNELRTFAESRLPLWEKIKIIDDIILKKKGPHICDTMMIMIKKSDTKKSKETTGKIHEDKIQVNKCNKNPKCYGKKNGMNENSKLIKFPQPLEPTVIITNRQDDTEDFDMINGNTNYKKPLRNYRKRPYQSNSSVNFDEIEIDNPKIIVPKKKKKNSKGTLTCSVKHDNSKKNHLQTFGEKVKLSVNTGEKEKRNCRVLRINNKKRFKASLRNKKLILNTKKNLPRNKNTQSIVNNKNTSNLSLSYLRNQTHPSHQVTDNLNIRNVESLKKEGRLRKVSNKYQTNKLLSGLHSVNNKMKQYPLKKNGLDSILVSNENKILTRQAAGANMNKSHFHHEHLVSSNKGVKTKLLETNAIKTREDGLEPMDLNGNMEDIKRSHC